MMSQGQQFAINSRISDFNHIWNNLKPRTWDWNWQVESNEGNCMAGQVWVSVWPPKMQHIMFLGGSETGLNNSSGPNPKSSQVTRTRFKLLQGCLIQTINTKFIELSTNTFLGFSFFPHLILWHTSWLSFNSTQINTFPTCTASSPTEHYSLS